MINPDLPVFATFWVGPYLSWIELMCLQSYMKHGHKVILYTRGEVKNIPAGIEVRSDQEVFDSKKLRLFIGAKKVGGFQKILQSPAALHADFFRWHLQKNTNYAHIEADRFLLRPFDLLSLQEIEQKGFLGYAFRRWRKNSKAAEFICQFLQQKYPIPPWFSPKEQRRLRWRKFIGRGVPIEDMKWGTASTAGGWALHQTGEFKEIFKLNRHLFEITDDMRYSRSGRLDLLFEAPAMMEAKFKEEKYQQYIVGLNHPVIFYHCDGKFREFLDHPPEGSWIRQRAKELGVHPEDAPFFETRKENMKYLAAITGDKSLLP